MKKMLFLLIPLFLLSSCGVSSQDSNSSSSSSIMSESSSSSSSIMSESSSSSEYVQTYIDTINVLINKPYDKYELMIKNDRVLNGSTESIYDKYALSDITDAGYVVDYNINTYSLIPDLSSSLSDISFINNIQGKQQLNNGNYSLVSGDDYDLSNKQIDISKISFKESYFNLTKYTDSLIQMNLVNTDFIKGSMLYKKGSISIDYSEDSLVNLNIYLELLDSSSCLISYTNFALKN